MRRFVRLVAPLAALAAAQCNPSPGPADGEARGDASATDGQNAVGDLPCDVANVLRTDCQSCHGATPVYGAPMPLVTYADLQAPAVTDPSRRVWQLVGQRTHDAARPMPPTGTLAATDLAVLDAWVAQQAPRGTGPACAAPDGGAGDAGAPVGPQYLSCPESERLTLVAHGDGAGAKFHVPATADNLYECFTWRSTFAQPTQATAFAPIIDDARVVHHWILYQTATAQTDGGAGPCNMPADAIFVAGWAPGGANRELPPDVGLELPGTDQWFILQVHYWNVAGYADANDASGVAFCATTDLREHSASVSTLGTLNIAVPPHATDYSTTGTCTPANTEPVHVLTAGPHMHQLGTSFQTVIYRGGDMAQSETLVDVPRWDFQAQTQYPSELVINPGDVLATTCHYQNPGVSTVYFGEQTEDEMCFDFVMAWPAGALANAAGAATRRCIDRPR